MTINESETCLENGTEDKNEWPKSFDLLWQDFQEHGGRHKITEVDIKQEIENFRQELK